MKLTNFAFKIDLENFQDAVCRKEYKKMDYILWRELKAVIGDVECSISYDPEIAAITISIDTESGICYYFDCGDKSFGDYFYNIHRDDLNSLRVDTPLNEVSTKLHLAPTGVAPITNSGGEINTASISLDLSEPYKSQIAALEAEMNEKASCDQVFALESYLYSEVGRLESQIMSYEEIKYIIDQTNNFPRYNDIYNLEAKLDTNVYSLKNQTSNLGNDLIALEANFNTLSEELFKALNRIHELEKINFEKEQKRSNNNMKGFNFDFGSCAGNTNLRMSMYGVAVQNASGSWVSYDPNAGKIIDVDIMNFDNCGQYLFKMPVAISEVKAGDIVVHNRKAMFITNVSEDGKITAIDPHAGEEKTILPTTSPFGFNFVTKIISMFNAMEGVSPTPSAPFGNMLPFLMMENDGKIDPMMMMLMMNGGKMDFSNPMFIYMMCKDNDDMSDMLPFMLMGGMGK